MFITTDNDTPLTREEEIELSKRVQQGDKRAKDEMIYRNIRLVKHIVKKYASSNVDFDDLFQEGIIGLIKAIERYDGERTGFAQYAYVWIKSSILKAIEAENTIRLPMPAHWQDVKYKQAVNKLENELERTPNEAEIASYLGVNMEEIGRLSHIRPETVALTPEMDEETGLEDVLGDIDVDYQNEVLKAIIDSNLDELPVRLRVVANMRFGLDGREESRTLNEVAQVLGLSYERIRQIELDTIDALRSRHSYNITRV